MTRIQFETDCRAAAVQLLKDFAQDASLTLQVYQARPRTIKPPTAFIDRMREVLTFDAMRERRPQVDIIFLWGLFDSGDAVAQRDQTIDAFIDWTTDRFHQAGPNTGIVPTTIDDDPNYVPDWLKPEDQRSYFATTMTLEGFSAGN